MKTRELAREMREAYRALKAADREELVRAGVPAHDVDYYQMVGVARMWVEQTDDGYRYQPDPDGVGRAFISPILAHHPDTLETPHAWACVRVGNLVDLLAWDPGHPTRWALRTGKASWLGAALPQFCNPPPTEVWRTPLNWFRNDCAGLVALTRDRAEVYRLLSALIGGIIVEDQAHADEIRGILERPRLTPPITIALTRQRVRRAA
jgi:hypothetical protein